VPILRQADLVIAFGAQLNDYTMGHGQLYKDAKFVQVDINPSAFDEYKQVDLAVLGDARLTAEALLTALDRIERPDWRGAAMARRIKAIDRWKGLDLDERPGRANERRVVDALDRLAPKDRLLVVDIGLFMGVPAPNMRVGSPGDIVFPWQLGRMGVATHVAAGCAVGRPDRLVTCFVGDGGFMAAVHALDTLRTEKLPMLLVVMDDGGFGAERHIYELRHQETHVCDYDTPDLVAMAKALGFKAFRVTSGAEMEQVLSRNDLRHSTTIVHVVIDFSVPATEMDYAIYKSSVPR
jgi:acetolactate synthase-1/2/3 large subunit